MNGPEVLMLTEIKELSKGITDILIAVAKIETEMRQVSGIAQKLDLTEKIVIRLERDLVSAFKKIDELKGQIDNLETSVANDKKVNKEDKKWLWGFAVGALALVWKFVETLNKGGIQ
jgi:hypothetical protein